MHRYFLRHLQRRARHDHSPLWPKVLGIDEHFFTRKKGYAITFCDLKNYRIYDVTLGRSEAALESYFLSLEGKEQVLVVCMDVAVVYRSIVKKHFPQAVIVADRSGIVAAPSTAIISVPPLDSARYNSAGAVAWDESAARIVSAHIVVSSDGVPNASADPYLGFRLGW